MKKLLALPFILLSLAAFGQTATLDYNFSNFGILDSSFVPSFGAKKVVSQPDGKVILAGQIPDNPFGILVIRLTKDGKIDPQFNTGIPVIAGEGMPDIDLADVAIESGTNKIVILAYGQIGNDTYTNTYLFKLNPNGNIDSTFGVGGSSKLDLGQGIIPKKMLMYPDKRIAIVGSNNGRIVATRTTPNGLLDASFNTAGRFFTTGTFENAQTATIDNSNRLLIGATRNITTTSMFLIRLNKDGFYDSTFNKTGRKDFNTGINSQIPAGIITLNNKIIIGASQEGNSCRFTLLYENGDLDSTYGKDGTYEKYLDAPFLSFKDFLMTKEGKFIMAGQYSYTDSITGTTYTAPILVKINKNGYIDSTSLDNGVYKFSNLYKPNNPLSIWSAALTTDGRIILAGQWGYNYFAMKANLKYNQYIYIPQLPIKYVGDMPFKLEPTTDAGLPVTYASTDTSIAKISGSWIVSKKAGQTNILAYQAGNDYYYPSTASEVLTVSATPIASVIGKEYIGPGSEQAYAVSPLNFNYTYYWHYTGNGIYFLTDTIGNAVKIYFSDNASSGVLICLAKENNEVVKTILYKPITVTKRANGSGTLSELKCTSIQSVCTDNYINSFKINTLSLDSSSCSFTAYSDYTESDYTTTLLLGALYTATVEVKSTSSKSKNIGIWIDYDNDGDFTDADDFVTTAFSDDTIIEIRNVVLKNQPEFEGSRRMRVRFRTEGKFTAADACQTSNESGETEDFLITLKEQEALQAPDIITPNDDGKNDFLVIRGVDNRESNELSIFNRLGEKKFNSSDYQNDWGGTSEGGQLLPQGTYYYIFRNGNNSIKGFFEIRY